jgi:hypothetical protein
VNSVVATSGSPHIFRVFVYFVHMQFVDIVWYLVSIPLGHQFMPMRRRSSVNIFDQS